MMILAGHRKLWFRPLIVKFDEIILIFTGPQLNRRPGVLIEMGGNEIGDHAAPFDFFPQRHKMVLDTFQDGSDLVF